MSFAAGHSRAAQSAATTEMNPVHDRGHAFARAAEERPRLAARSNPPTMDSTGDGSSAAGGAGLSAC